MLLHLEEILTSTTCRVYATIKDKFFVYIIRTLKFYLKYKVKILYKKNALHSLIVKIWQAETTLNPPPLGGLATTVAPSATFH